MIRIRFRSLMLAAVLFSVCCSVARAAEPSNPALREELLQMRTVDQAVRTQGGKVDFEKWQKVDAANAKRLKEIVAEHGWPTTAMVGKDGASAAWLLAQHADSDPAFQQRVLALMEPLVKDGEASEKDFAYLYDRTHYPQRYGTQGTCVSHEEWQPFEIEDVSHVDERRRNAGIMPIADYIARFKDICADTNVGIEPVPGRRTVKIGQKSKES